VDRIHDLLTDDFVDHGPPVSPTPGPDGHITILTFVTTVLPACGPAVGEIEVTVGEGI